MPEQIKRTTIATPNGLSDASDKPSGFNENGTAGRDEGATSEPNEHSIATAGGLAAAGGAGAALLSGVTPQSTTSALAGSVPKEGEEDAGAAIISTVTPQSTTAGLAGSVPKEGEQDAGAAIISTVTPQSTTAGLAGSVPKEGEKDAEEDGEKQAATDEPGHSTSLPGTFPEETPTESQDFGVQPIPASEGIGNPVSVPAGEKVPDPSTINTNTTDSTATTSKEGYEKDASAAFPAVAAAAGVGIAGAAGAGAYAHEKTSEADSYGVNPIPASSGIGNPISVPAGEKLPEQSSFNSNTVQSTATTSKEDYEKDASAPAAIAGGTGAAAAADSAFSVPEKSKNMIPESSLPIGGEVKDTTDTGPFISSAAPNSSTSDMAAAVPLEPKRQAVVVHDDEAPSATLSGPAPTVPEMVKESFSEAHQSPEAAGSAEAVGEKALVEDELLKKVKSTDAAGEPAPSSTAPVTSSAPVSGVAPSVPAVVKDSISQAHQPAEAAAAQEVVNEKRDVESELLREVKPTDAVGEPAPSAAATATSSAPVSGVAENVPDVVKESLREAHQLPEAAAAPEVVNEKKDVESELLRSVKTTDATGEHAPTAAAVTSETAPKATGETATLVSPTATADTATRAAPDEAAATEPPATTTENQDQSQLSTEPTAPATPAKATTTDSTPTKSTPGPAAAGTATAESAASSPASTATKEQKKKNRRSFFGRLKDKIKEL